MIHKKVLAFVAIVAALGSMACKEVDLATDQALNSLAVTEEQEKALFDSAVDSMSATATDIESSVDLEAIDVIEDPFNSDVANPDIGISPDAPDSDEIDDLEISQYEICPEPAFKQECISNGDRSMQKQQYNRCLLEGTRTIVSGKVHLGYNNPECSLAEDGFKVRRTHNMVFFHYPTKKLVKSSSHPQRNYLGNPIGGGEKLVNTGFGWKVAVKGANIDVLQKETGERPKKKADVSVHNQRPFKLFDKREDGAVYLHGGSLLVNHNLAQFTAKYVPKALKWVADCKCPVSGQLFFKYRGSKTGAGYIDFESCGEAILHRKNGGFKKLSNPKCEVETDEPAPAIDPDVLTDFESDLDPVDETDLEDDSVEDI